MARGRICVGECWSQGADRRHRRANALRGPTGELSAVNQDWGARGRIARGAASGVVIVMRSVAALGKKRAERTGDGDEQFRLGVIDVLMLADVAGTVRGVAP